MKDKRRKFSGTVSKVLTFLVFVIGILFVWTGTQCTQYMYEEGIYSENGENLEDTYLEQQMSEIAVAILKKWVMGTPKESNRYAAIYNIDYIIKQNGNIIGSNGVDTDFIWCYEYRFGEYEAGRYVFDDVEDYSIRIYLKDMPPIDNVWWSYHVLKNSSWLKFAMPAIIGVGGLCVLWSFIFILRKIGWCPQSEEVTAGRFGRIPTDLFTAICLVLCVSWAWVSESLSIAWLPEKRGFIVAAGIFLVSFLWFLSMVARYKAKVLLKNWYIFHLWRKTKELLFALGKIVLKIPLVWKAVCIVLGICLLEGLVLFICVTYWNEDVSKGILVVLWIAEKLILVPGVMYIVLKLRVLKEAGKALAEGQLDHKVDEKEFFWDLKEHAHHLNSISDGVNLAVQERMKSEHFKTELITNVSHDIKTPLTSIINYSDLLSKEETDNEKIREYAQVLYRQSGRLKKLVDDLLEASKASTGSLEVQMEECQVAVLLEQAVGEFASRLYENNIDVICKIPGESVKIMADGRLLWRVFDNLLNNICKYTQKDTRVYLSVEKEKDSAVVTFKNISAYPLDITEEELMERFVRGDKSRHTEGNGLGLNIAKSLVELQNGTMKLVIDGDLFKAILAFPIIE